MKRRDTVAALGTATIVAPLSGCLDFAGLRPDSNDEQKEQDNAADRDRADDTDAETETEAEDEDDAEDNDGSEDDADGEGLDLADVEQRDAGEDVTEFGGLQITSYDEEIDELEDGGHADEQVRYTGEVENVGKDAYGSVTVEVRVYDEAGDEIGSHRDLTPEVGPGETWRFEISPHSRPEEIADHDIAVTGEQ
jgi:hypothetical protein